MRCCLQAFQHGEWMPYSQLNLRKSFTLYSNTEWLIEHGYMSPPIPPEEEIIEIPSYRAKIKPYFKSKNIIR